MCESLSFCCIYLPTPLYYCGLLTDNLSKIERNLASALQNDTFSLYVYQIVYYSTWDPFENKGGFINI